MGEVRVERCGGKSLAARRGAWAALTVGAPGALRPSYTDAALLAGLCDNTEVSVLFAYHGDVMVAVWPLHLSRGRLSVLRHIGNGGHEEYAGPFLAPGLEPEPILDALWAGVLEIDADLVEVYNLHAESPTLRFLKRTQKRTAISQITGKIMHTGAVSWAEWLVRKPKAWRDKLKYYRNRLAKQGAVTFERITEADAAAHAQWCIWLKRDWLEVHKIGESWLRSPSAIAFYASLIGREGGGEGFALKVDGVPVAGCFCLVDDKRCEFTLTVYDEAWASHSPGNVLIEYLAQWCAERGLDLDFRFPIMPYKAHWADADETVYSVAVALTSGGAMELRKRKLNALVRNAKRAVKKLMRRGK